MNINPPKLADYTPKLTYDTMSANKEKGLIKDKIFEGPRGPIPSHVLNKLRIRGEDGIDDALAKFGWDGAAPVVVPIITIDPDTGAVIGSRFAVRGTISTQKISASNIWSGADKDITVSWDLNGRSFKFSNRGTSLPSNFSDWIDSESDNAVKLKQGDDTTINFENILDGKKVGLNFRLEIHLTGRTSAALYLAMVPISNEDMQSIAETWETDLAGDKIPVSLAFVGPNQKDSKYGALEARLFVAEKETDGSGFGIFPLIEQVSIPTQHNGNHFHKYFLNMGAPFHNGHNHISNK